MTTKVAERSKASAAMLAAAAKGRVLMGGTTAMRAAAETYLPKFAKESVLAYDARLRSSWLFNGYRKTVRDMTGRVFAKPVELAEAPSPLDEWCENVDMQGRDLSTFAHALFVDTLSGPAIGFIMVDAPRREGVVTQAQARAGNMRPYMTHLRLEDVLGWKTATVDNVTTLTQIRIHEAVEEADPADEFGTLQVEQVRVLDLIAGRVQVRVYRKSNDTRKGWVIVDEFPTEQTEIMVAPFYANRTGFFTAEPLLDDLADINVAHWQSQSDQRNILHVARVPILFGSGFDTDSAIVIGSNEAVVSGSPDAKLQWVEHSGKAIEAGRQDLKDLEFQMETFGLQLLAARPSAQSATGEALDAAKETSILSMTADQLKDSLERALSWMVQLGGLTGEVAVQVNKEFATIAMNAQDVSALLQGYRDGVLSRQTLIEEFARRGFIRADITADDEADRRDEEETDDPNDAAMAMGGAAQPGGMPLTAGS